MRILLGGEIIWPTSSHRKKFKIGGKNSKDLLYKIMINCGFEKLQDLSNPALESPLSICLSSFPNPGRAYTNSSSSLLRFFFQCVDLCFGNSIQYI